MRDPAKKAILLATAIGIMILVTMPAVRGASLKYTPPCLENVTNLSGGSFASCSEAPSAESITGYISNIYRFLIGIAGVLALGMIVAGAIRISLQPGSIDQQSEGRSMIFSAIIGLVVVFGSYIILSTINPSLVFLEGPQAPMIEDTSASSTISSCNPGATLPPGTYDNQTAFNELVSATKGNMFVEQNCSVRCGIACVDLWGLPMSAVRNLRYIADYCVTSSNPPTPCTVTINGGTESVGIHDHGPGQPTVDMRFNKDLATYLLNSFRANIDKICTDPQQAAYRYNCKYDEVSGVLHVKFK